MNQVLYMCVYTHTYMYVCTNTHVYAYVYILFQIIFPYYQILSIVPYAVPWVLVYISCLHILFIYICYFYMAVCMH